MAHLGGPLDPADILTVQDVLNVVQAFILRNYRNLQKGALLTRARANFWDEASGLTYRDALARFEAVEAEFQRLQAYLAAAKNVIEFQHRPRGDENAVTRRITNTDIRQRIAELNTAIVHLQATLALVKTHIYIQHAGYIGNAHGHAPPANARLVHIEGTADPEPGLDPGAETEPEGSGKTGSGKHMARGDYWHGMQNRR